MNEHEAMARVCGVAVAHIRGDRDQIEVGRQMFANSSAFVVGSLMLIDYLAEQVTSDGQVSSVELLQAIALNASKVAAEEEQHGG